MAKLPVAPVVLLDMVGRQQALDDQLATLAEQVKLLEAERRQLNETDIPELAQQLAQLNDEELREMGEVQFALPDGGTLTFTRHYYPGISKADEKPAHTWLMEQGFFQLFKISYTLQFGLKEFELARRFQAMVNTLFPTVVVDVVLDPDARQDAVVPALKALVADAFPKRTLKEELDIPPQTLKAFVKKCYETGVQLPATIGVYAPWRAKVVA